MDTAGRGGEGRPGLPLRGRPGLEPNEPRRPRNDRAVALLITLFVAGVVAVVTTGTFYWIRYLAIGEELAAAQAAAATLSGGGYYPGQAQQVDDTGRVTQVGYGPPFVQQKIIETPENFPGDPVRSWYGGDAWNYANQQAGEYVAANPQPQNVQILTGMTTQQIWTYMQQHVSGALGVSCQYCHNLAEGPEGYANFGQETEYGQYNKKVSARLMLGLVNDLNRDWVANGVLPGWKGNYVNCATCHNGQPKNMAAYPPEYFELIPVHYGTDYKQAVNDEIIYDYELSLPGRPIPGRENVPEGQGELSLTYEGGPNQDAVWLNQYAMYTMGWSLGVGCNYCHNSRNFVSYEKVQKVKAQRMLLMTTFLNKNWAEYGAQANADGKLVVPGCYTCHNGNGVPNAAMNVSYITSQPAEQQQIQFPEVLRGLPQ